MPRAMGNVPAHRRHKKILKAAKGFYAGRHARVRAAKETLIRAGVYALRDRRAKKRQFRRLWITRINAAARAHDITYSRLINGLAKANVSVDRKIMADLAVADDKAFAELVAIAKKSLG